MNARLNVLMVQSPRLSGLQSGIQESLVMRLLGAPGLDVAIVSSLEMDQASETEQLLLSSLSGDLAVIDWRAPADVLASLERLGILVARAPHRLDPHPSAPANGRRKAYVIDLRNGDSADAVAESLRRLLEERRVIAVPLGAKIGPPPPAPTPRVIEPRRESLGRQSTPEIARQTAAASASPEPTAVTDTDLDAWVDGVNDADW